MVMLTQVEINGTDVTSHIVNYELERTYGYAISQITISTLKTIDTLLALETGQTIVVYRGWTVATEEKIFDGYIESFVPEGGKITINGKDKLWDLVRKEVTHTYDKDIDASAGKISEMFKDLVETYGGLTAEVQDSGTITVLDKFVCNHTDIFERCQALNKIMDWQFYYKPDTGKVYFEPQGYVSNSTVLTVGDNIYQVPKWTYDNTEMANDIIVVGAYQEIETTESGRIGTTAGYTTDYYKLDFKPISVRVYMDASSPPTTLKVGGIPTSTETYDYYVNVNESASNTDPDWRYKIMPAVGTSFNSNDYAETRYSHAVSIPIHMYTQASIDKYGNFSKTVTYTDIRTISDAEMKGNNYLIKYSTPFIYASLKVKNDSTYGLNVGQLIKVVDQISTPTVNSYLLITKYTIRYPSDYDEVLAGDKTWRLATWQASVEERLKRIAEEQLTSTDIVLELVSFDNTSLFPITTSPRYRWITRKDGTVGTDNFILGTSLLGTGKLGDFGEVTATNHFIQQYQNIYTETFYDTDFEDADNTTGTWDTTNNQLVL